MRLLLRSVGLLLGFSLAVLLAVPARAAGIGVTAGSVQAGGTIIVEGNVLVPPDNHLPPGVAGGEATVTLLSRAFPGGTATAAGSVTLHVMGDVSLAPGRFRGAVPIRGDALSGDYTLTGIFAGSVIGTAHFTVVGAAVTPQPSAQPTTPATAQPATPATAQPTVRATVQPTTPATARPATTTAAQWPAWWPAGLAGLLILLLSPWVGILLLWRRRF